MSAGLSSNFLFCGYLRVVFCSSGDHVKISKQNCLSKLIQAYLLAVGAQVRCVKGSEPCVNECNEGLGSTRRSANKNFNSCGLPRGSRRPRVRRIRRLRRARRTGLYL